MKPESLAEKEIADIIMDAILENALKLDQNSQSQLMDILRQKQP